MMATQTQPAAPDGDDPTAIVADDKAVNPVQSRAVAGPAPDPETKLAQTAKHKNRL